jgi:hypothetical protein
MSERASGFDRDPHDWYVEPAWCVELLAAAEHLNSNIWDPACGNSTILRVFRKRGHTVFGTDIEHRHGADGPPLDFMSDAANLYDQAFNSIICNPPYHTVPGTRISMAEAFALRALGLTRHKAALLVKLSFLSSDGRYRLFTDHPPSKVWILSERASMPPGRLLDPETGRYAVDVPANKIRRGDAPSGGSIDFAWIVWERGYQGEPAIGWLKRP